MKTILLLSIFAALAVAPLGASAEARPKPEPIVGSVAPRRHAVENAGRAALGATRDTVLRAIGEPDARLTDAAWIYWDCEVSPRSVNPHGYDTLVVIFDGDFVSTLKAVRGTDLRQALDRSARDRFTSSKDPRSQPRGI